MRKHSALCVALAALLCLSLASCGGTAAPAPAAPSAAAPAASASAPEAPKTDWPNRQVRVVCGYAAGGSDDIICRAFIDALNRNMPNGQAMYVENVVGASGTVGATEVVRSDPDGYTLMCCGTGVLCGQPLTIGTEYDGTTVATICQIAEISQAMVVRSDAPYDDLEGWVKWCKEHPGEFTYATSGKNGPGHIGSTAVAKAAGIEITPVFFSGIGEGIPQMLGGQLMGACSKDNDFVSYVESGQCKLIYLTNPNGYWGDKLQITETYPGTGYVYGTAFFGPPDMPKEIIDEIYALVQTSFATEEYKKAFDNIGVIPVLFGPEETAAKMVEYLEFNRGILKSLGIEPKR